MAIDNDIESKLPVRNDGEYAVDNDGGRPASSGTIVHIRKGTGVSPAQEDQLVRPTGTEYDDGSSNVVVQDVGIRDEDGKPFDKDNPMPVSIEESEGDEIHEHDESASAIAKNADDDQDYTVTALKEFELEQWGISASGYMRGELQVETGVATDVFDQVDVLFNSVANPNASNLFKRPIKVGAGIKVRITRTNLDNQSQGLYSFLNGLES